MQSVTITTKSVSLNREVNSIQHYVIKFVRSIVFFSVGTLVSYTNNTDDHDINEILLKVVLNAITPLLRKLQYFCAASLWYEEDFDLYKQSVYEVWNST